MNKQINLAPEDDDGDDDTAVRDNRGGNWWWAHNDCFLVYGEYLGPYGLVVYFALCSMADIKSQDCWPSIQTLAKMTGASANQVRNTLHRLQEYGLIKIKKRGGIHTAQESNRYVLRPIEKWLLADSLSPHRKKRVVKPKTRRRT